MNRRKLKTPKNVKKRLDEIKLEDIYDMSHQAPVWLTQNYIKACIDSNRLEYLGKGKKKGYILCLKSEAEPLLFFHSDDTYTDCSYDFLIPERRKINYNK